VARVLIRLYGNCVNPRHACEQFTFCEQFKAALETQEPLESCACFSGDCAARGTRTVICPSGFWGFRHALGLPVSIGGAPDVPTEIGYGEAPSVTLGVATDLTDQEAHTQAIRALLAGSEIAYADSFEQLLAALKQGRADVVYLYCHGGLDRGVWPYVRVGPEGKPVLTADILFSERVRWDSPRPLVFINGCRTAAVEPEKVVELVGALVGTAHAAGVIGTEITVFEPMATVFGLEYLRRFLDGSPVGEAIRGARLALLGAGNPLGLVYVPFALGSCGWVAFSSQLTDRSAPVQACWPRGAPRFAAARLSTRRSRRLVRACRAPHLRGARSCSDHATGGLLPLSRRGGEWVSDLPLARSMPIPKKRRDPSHPTGA
jgi:hypothetical protein